MAKKQAEEFDLSEPDQVRDDELQMDFVDTTKEVINTADHAVRFIMDGVKHVMKPLEVRRIPATYASPRKLQPNAPALPSTVEHLTGSKVLPIDHEKARPFLARAGVSR